MTDTLSKSIKSTTHELSWANRGLKGNSAADVKELCNEIEKCKPLKALRLEGNTINEAAATAIGKALEKHPEIERLIWNDLFTTRLKTEVPSSLIKLTQGLLSNGSRIVEINLSDNAFGPIGVKGLETFLSSSACFTLEELRLNNCGMGSMGGKLLADALIACHKNSIVAGGKRFALKQFIAGRNRLEIEGSQALAKAFEIIGTLEVIRIPQNGIQPPGIEALTTAFVHNRNLRVIDLNDNTITSAAGTLASAIEKLPKLEIINLESSLIRTRGAISVARAIVSHKNLQEVYLGCNDMNTDGGLEVARAVKNMSSLKVLDLNGNCFGPDGIDEIRGVLEKKSFIDQMTFSDDEGSDEEEEVENESNEEEDDEYQEAEEEQQEEESPSFFFGTKPAQSQNGFQFGVPPPTSSNPESVSGLSSMMAKFEFNASSSFNFGTPSSSETKEKKWSTFTSIAKAKDYIQNDEQSIERAVQSLEDIWHDPSLSQADGSSMTKNILQSLTFTTSNERNFNERLLVTLGFVKDEQTGRLRRAINQREKLYQTLIDSSRFLPQSTKKLLWIFLQNTLNDHNQSLVELKQNLLKTIKG